LLMDMTVPAHVLMDAHANYLTSKGTDSYEQFTKYSENYKNIISNSSNTSIPNYKTLNNYTKYTPSSYNNYLTRLAYNLAEHGDNYDSDDKNGEITNGGYNDWPAKNDLYTSRTVSYVDEVSLLGNYRKRLYKGTHYELHKVIDSLSNLVYRIYYYDTYHSSINNTTNGVKVYYTNGTSEKFYNLDELIGGYSVVPSTVLKEYHQAQLESRAIGYVAALYQLFWDETRPIYTVSYSANNATSGTAPASQTKTHGVSLTLRTNTGNLTKTGYTFDGWNTNSSGTGTDYPAGGTYTANTSDTLYAKWKPRVYTISYNSNNATSGTAPSSQTKTHGVNLTLRTNTGNLTRTGYTFDGWNTNSSGTGTDYPAGGTYTANASDTLYAKWKPLVYTISYNSNNATSGTAPSSQTKTHGVSLTLRTNTGNLAKNGYTFDGWNTNSSGTGTNYPAGGTYTANTSETLYAKWTPLTTYTISYDANSATSGTAPGSQTKTHGMSLTLRTNTGNLTKTGYTFDGWNTNSSGTGTNYPAGGTYTANTSETLYAKWTPLSTYTISYDANNATSGTAPGSQTKTHGVSVTLRTNTGNLIKTGYTFDGWNTNSSGTGTNYPAGGTYTANTSDTLYAKWIDEQTGLVVVSGGCIATPDPVILEQNFTVDFTLKEINGFPVLFESIKVTILQSDNTHLFDLVTYNNVTISSNSTWSKTPSGKISDNPIGVYKAVIRGKLAGGTWFDFSVTGDGINPKSFDVISPNPWDFNSDKIVNYIDLGLFADHWLLDEDHKDWDPKFNLSTVPSEGKQIINYQDLNIFADHWLEEY